MPRKSRTGLIPKALKRAINVSLPYTRKLRSSAPMDNDTDAQRIRACLANYGTPQEMAEEGFRVCRVNAGLRTELDKIKKVAATATATTTAVPTHSSAVSAFTSAHASFVAGTIPIVRTSTVPIADTNMFGTAPAILPKDQLQTTKALKNKIAVMEDALAEMRSEAPKMRECMAWMWEIIGNERINHIPKQLRDMYHETMVVDLVDWQPQGRVGGGGGGGGKNPDLKNTKGKEEVKIKKEGSLTADNVVAGAKRKSMSPLANDTKKLKVG